MQAAVLVVTTLHGTLESLGHDGQLPEWAGGMSQVPVHVYLIPVAYAGLRYGTEGGVLTGLVVFVLSSPNLLIFHHHGFEWLGELISVVFVVAAGVVIALVVEKALHARAEADVANRRLTLLNEVASSVTRSIDAQHLLDLVLDTLVESDEFVAAHFLPGGDEMLLLPAIRGGDLSQSATYRSPNPATTNSDALDVPVGSVTNNFGVLRIIPARGSGPTGVTVELATAIGRELGRALDGVRSRDRERDSMKSYIREVTKAQEEERRRIARELHDGAAQSLVVINRGLTGLTEQLPEPALHKVESLKRTTAGALDAIRRVSHALRPAVLDDLGLIPAVEWLVSQLANRSDLHVSCTVVGETRRLSDDLELAVFRVAQETLNNVERHAEAGRVSVSLSFADHSVLLTITDDGIGIDNGGPADEMTLGLTGMRERAELVGGDLRIESEPGMGTTVLLHVET